MEKISIQDINFSLLRKLHYQGTKSIVYRDIEEKYAFKILTDYTQEEKELLYNKFLDMDGIEIANVSFPIALIMQDGKLEGYVMEYFRNAIPIIYKYLGRYVDCQELFSNMIDICKILREVHSNDIIVQDFNFDNILINDHGEIFISDIDSCSYHEFISPYASLLIKRLINDYRKEKIPISKNLDRVSMMALFFNIMYAKEIQKCSRRQYHYLANHLTTLQNMKPYANMLVDKTFPISHVPYLDELIDQNDNYIIDRKKQLSLVNRIF